MKRTQVIKQQDVQEEPMNGRSTLRKAIAGLLKKTSSKVTTETPNPDSNTNDSLVERTRSIRVK